MEADIVYTPVAEAPDGQEVAGVVETPVPSGGGEAGAAVPVWVLPAILVLLAVAAAIAAWLMLRKKRRTCAAASHPLVGKLHEQGERSSQQDSFSVSPAEIEETHGLLVAVADGMGGLSDGDRVSQTAVSAVMDNFICDADTGRNPEQTLLELLRCANDAVNRFLGYSRIGQCGSTIVLGLLKDGYFHFLSVGDSRIYLYRDGELMQLNREHIYRHELELLAVNGSGTIAGAAAHPRAAGLTSYLGMGQIKYIDQCEAPVKALRGDSFILMTDGVYNALGEDELKAALKNDAQAAADAIGAAVRLHSWPGQDNYTAVVIKC